METKGFQGSNQGPVGPGYSMGISGRSMQDGDIGIPVEKGMLPTEVIATRLRNHAFALEKIYNGINDSLNKLAGPNAGVNPDKQPRTTLPGVESESFLQMMADTADMFSRVEEAFAELNYRFSNLI